MQPDHVDLPDSAVATHRQRPTDGSNTNDDEEDEEDMMELENLIDRLEQENE